MPSILYMMLNTHTHIYMHIHIYYSEVENMIPKLVMQSERKSGWLLSLTSPLVTLINSQAMLNGETGSTLRMPISSAWIGKPHMGASRSGHEPHKMPCLKLVVTLCPLISLAPEAALSCLQSLLGTTQYHILSHLAGLKILTEILTGSFS